MSPVLLLSVFALINKHSTPAWSAVEPSCSKFLAGSSYDESQALGLWHLVHFRSTTLNFTGKSHCMEFGVVEEEDRDILKTTYQNYVSDVDWHAITLRMTIPCQARTKVRQRHYYLERVNRRGTYNTLLFPTTKTYDQDAVNPTKLCLKLVEDKYLSVMDCYEKYIFIFSKQFPRGSANERRLAKMVEDYWA